jgi:hypothetical protein
MLDAYIIDRIRREEEQARSKRVQLPLTVDDDRPRKRPARESEPKPERGSVIIDLSI